MLALHESIAERSAAEKLDVEDPFRKQNFPAQTFRQALSCKNPAGAELEEDAAVPMGPLRDLMDRICTNHHAHVRYELSRLCTMAKEVSVVYGRHRPELIRVQALVADLEAEMQLHMTREENGLFQCIARMENAVERGIPLSPATVDSLANPVRNILHEHDKATEMMAKLRSLTGGFHAPWESSVKLKELYASLGDLERTLHQHMLMENKVLFPRALALEAHLR